MLSFDELFVELCPECRGTKKCEGCGMPLYESCFPKVVHVPGVPGLFCSIGCVETVLFGHGRCRWCGSEMSNPYKSVKSRLCSDDCTKNYFALVRGEMTARLGTGTRLAMWLQARKSKQRSKKEPELPGRSCQQCGADISFLRAGARYCSHACRMSAKRESRQSLTPKIAA